MRIKIQQINLDIVISSFAGVNRLFVLTYPNQNNNVKRFNTQKHYLPKSIIKNYDVISNGKRLL